ncbi:MAG: efflux RND transporter periplasmic adaptor subunit [Betaproteobacteria bacterium]|jgi:cobalt-zinc-cadmium efflux system membrane fusion protein|nr:efflux RND transporter periplasmic adaptor subunit [Betaproteobacteria bacterium]NBP39323.1 efflux RND transporter periplasmic adaptor subunit [Betaproteobacteria bacterium]NBY55512.1 efflux RND transporter periplasmic adaptor subunit [Betaproteobacteria bacterium]NDF50069.1 efflux RND transporter periplasmic adaptor subunit [Betaproteobacteria bacterium]
MLNQTLILLLIVTTLTACADRSETPKASSSPVYQAGSLQYPEQHPQLKLLTLSPVRQAQIEKIELPARLVWNEERTQRVYSAFSGRVATISADLGQHVAAGQVLAKLSSPDFGAAQSEAQRAQAEFNLAKQTFERQQKLFELGVIARKELDQSNAELRRSEAAFELAQSRIKLYENPSTVNLELALRAALNGVVVERNINPSQELRPESNQVPLFVISDPTSLWLQIDAQERDLANLSPGTAIEVKVTSLAERVYPARLAVIGEQIDPITRSIKLRAVVSNPDRSLKSEMLAKAVYQKQSKGLLEVPSSAVFLKGKQHAVFVATNPSRFELRDVDVAELASDRTLIRAGLQEAEQVVTQNALLLLREIKFAEDNAISPPMKSKP